MLLGQLLAVIAVSLWFGFVFGCTIEWCMHRRYCACSRCTKWREEVVEKSKKLAEKATRLG